MINRNAEMDDPGEDARGVTTYRRQLARIMGGRDTEKLRHDKIIAKLDESTKLFHIVVLKSTLAIPYTPVSLELDCWYWKREAEQRLRLSMARRNPSAQLPAKFRQRISKQ